MGLLSDATLNGLNISFLILMTFHFIFICDKSNALDIFNIYKTEVENNKLKRKLKLKDLTMEASFKGDMMKGFNPRNLMRVIYMIASL